MMQQHIQGLFGSSDGLTTGAARLKGQSNYLHTCHSSGLQTTNPTAPCDCDTDCTEGPWDLDPQACCCCGALDCTHGPCDFSRSLPTEMSEQIFLRLDPPSLCSAAQTCRRWHRLIHSSEAVWRGQCLLLRAHCSREVDRDRGHGYSWKVTLVRNYARSRLKRDWLRGRFSCVRSANELQDVRMVSLDADSWGEILQAELDR